MISLIRCNQSIIKFLPWWLLVLLETTRSIPLHSTKFANNCHIFTDGNNNPVHYTADPPHWTQNLRIYVRKSKHPAIEKCMRVSRTGICKLFSEHVGFFHCKHYGINTVFDSGGFTHTCHVYFIDTGVIRGLSLWKKIFGIWWVIQSYESANT